MEILAISRQMTKINHENYRWYKIISREQIMLSARRNTIFPKPKAAYNNLP